MATLFRGMGKDSFLDELVEKTGLNGHELYDYIMSVVETKKETATKATHLVFYANETKTFEGSREEFYDYLRLLSGNSDEKFGGVSPFGLCVYAAKLNKVKHFVWTRPIQRRTLDGQLVPATATESVFLDDYGEPKV